MFEIHFVLRGSKSNFWDFYYI